MTNPDIHSFEALLIKKIPVGESDIAVTLFTERRGKIRAFAKNAASSRKRFGGRLEPFTLLNIELTETRGGRKVLQSSEIVKSFEDVANNMSIFLKANCVLEIIDSAVTAEDVPCEDLFTEAADALCEMSKGKGFSAMLRFQAASLKSLGYGIDFSRCAVCGGKKPERGFLVFPSGEFLCAPCGRKCAEKPARSIQLKDGAKNAARAQSNINCLNDFFQYQTGAVLKSAKLLENMLTL